MFITFLINSFLISAAVVIHYEVLRLLWVLLPRLIKIKNTLRVIIGVFGAICTHILEV
jgi:hypothetical protein